MAISDHVLDLNKDLADAVFGRERIPAPDDREHANEEARARAFAPFIVTMAACAVAGGVIGFSPNQRKALGGVAALMFLAL